MSVMLALEAGFLALAVSVALSLSPAVVGANWTVTRHDFPLPIAVPVQAFEVIENADEPESEAASMAVAEPPEFLSVNVCDAVCPGVTVP
jgi:hypothetical protein